jgi:hypothetical protein
MWELSMAFTEHRGTGAEFILLSYFMLLVTVTGWYSTKRPMHCDHFLISCAPHPSSKQSRFIHHSSLHSLLQTPSSEAG